MLKVFFKKNSYNVSEIYQNIVKISRSKFFYVDLDLDDTFETRFDLIIFHAFIIFYYYKEIENEKSEIAQNLFDYMFSDFENNLREMGFGDIAVNKKMKLFIRAFYGRLAQYSKGLEMKRKKNDKRLLEQAILNNIYKGRKEKKLFVELFANYMSKNINKFLSESESKNLKSNFEFLKFS